MTVRSLQPAGGQSDGGGRCDEGVEEGAEEEDEKAGTRHEEE